VAARPAGTLGSDSCKPAGEERAHVRECKKSLECRVAHVCQVIRSIVSGRLLPRRQITFSVGAAAGDRGAQIYRPLPVASGGGRLPSVRARASQARPSA